MMSENQRKAADEATQHKRGCSPVYALISGHGASLCITQLGQNLRIKEPGSAMMTQRTGPNRWRSREVTHIKAERS